MIIKACNGYLTQKILFDMLDRIVKKKENGSHANLCDNISFLRDEIMT